MKVLVTGATGFIGNHTVLALTSRGHEVVAVARQRPHHDKVPWLDKVEFIECDLHTPGIKPAYVLGVPDVMVHLAWSGLSDFKADLHIEHNLPADIYLLTSMLGAGLRHLLVAGTCFEYGLQEGCLDEQAEAKPNIPYAVAKHLLRLGLEKHISPQSVLQWARIFYVYGPSQAPHTLMSQLDTAIDNGEAVFNMSGGEQERDYLPVQEVARRIVALVEHPEVCGIINCCSGKPVTIRSLVEERLRERSATINLNLGHYPYSPDEPMSFWGNSSKIDKLTLPPANNIVTG